jgi:hypothetical protein
MAANQKSAFPHADYGRNVLSDLAIEQQGGAQAAGKDAGMSDYYQDRANKENRPVYVGPDNLNGGCHWRFPQSCTCEYIFAEDAGMSAETNLNESFDRMAERAVRCKRERDELLAACKFAHARALQAYSPDSELIAKLAIAIYKAEAMP